MVEVGAAAPDFEGTGSDGVPISLRQLRGRPLVLYFYPKASSLGCAREAQEFARNYPEFERRGVALVGVSVDSVEAQRRFAEECRLPFPLVADRSGSIARAYGVLGLLGMAKRVTFFVGSDGRVEEIVSGIRPQPHVRRAVERLSSAPPRDEPGRTTPGAP